MLKINLTDDDQLANKQGLLSEKQQQKLSFARWRWIAGTIALLGVAVSITAVLLLKWYIPSFANHGQLFIALPVLFFWLWSLKEMPRLWQKANLDLNSKQVARVEGPLQTHIDLGMGLLRPVYYMVQVNGRSFSVTKEEYLLFQPGRLYCIYFTPQTHQFLGAMPLAEMPPLVEAPPLAEMPKLAEQPAPNTPPPSFPELPEPLTMREQKILQLIAVGRTNQEIANELCLSVNTIKMYTSQLYQKLGVSRRTEAVAFARTHHLI